MKRPWIPEVEAALGVPIDSVAPVSGGDINAAHLVTLRDGGTIFVKTHRDGAAADGRFACEASGLCALRVAAADTSLRVPEVVAVGGGFLALEVVDFSPPGPGFEEQLGRGLAELHRCGTADAFGFEADNYLGRLPQDNTVARDWVTFWRDRRLLPLLGVLPEEREVQALGHRLAERLDALLTAPPEVPTLIHGDLWSGNAGVDRAGRIWIYDPACYHSHREAEFGMTRLFGFGRRFEAAYDEAYPLADGWERRVEVYRLHHLLSHLWHFGTGYRAGCVALLEELLR